jgi:hypothetical protein
MIGAYIAPEPDRSAIINELIVLFEACNRARLRRRRRWRKRQYGKAVAGGRAPAESSERAGSAALFSEG